MGRLDCTAVSGSALTAFAIRAMTDRHSQLPSKAGAAQAGQHRHAPAHDVPEQARAVVLDHQHHRPLVDPEVVRRNPPAGRAIVHRERRVERGLEPVPGRHPQVHPGEMAHRRDDDLRSEGERGDHDPRGDGTVVRAERGAARDVIEELALDAVDRALGPARAVAGREPPAVLAVAREAQRIADRVLLLDEGRLPAVFEIVGATLPA